MRFLSKLIGSTILGLLGDLIGGWLWGFSGELIGGLILSIIGWYGAGYLHTRYID